VYKLDKEIYNPIPSWVNSEMISSIKKKQDSPLYTKIGSIYINAVIQNRTFISWTQLEKYLDIITNNIQNSGQTYNAVVGIRTGGAIISDYISQKLNLPNYKIKLSRSDYNCNKQPYNAINDIVKKNVLSSYGEFQVCEGIDDNLQGKNIILIDELVSSGKTINEAYDYLKNEKQVSNIYPTTISLYKEKYKGNINVNYVIEGTVAIWPWGYDN
jgi:hypoxanthine phosphoribosyltransferase